MANRELSNNCLAKIKDIKVKVGRLKRETKSVGKKNNLISRREQNALNY